MFTGRQAARVSSRAALLGCIQLLKQQFHYEISPDTPGSSTMAQKMGCIFAAFHILAPAASKPSLLSTEIVYEYFKS